MARGFSKAIIVGNLTRDPELRTTASGTQVCSISVAVRVRNVNPILLLFCIIFSLPVQNIAVLRKCERRCHRMKEQNNNQRENRQQNQQNQQENRKQNQQNDQQENRKNNNNR